MRIVDSSKLEMSFQRAEFWPSVVLSILENQLKLGFQIIVPFLKQVKKKE